MSIKELKEKYKDFIKITITDIKDKSIHEYILNLNDPKDILIGKKIRQQTTFKARKLYIKEMIELEEWENFLKNEC